jgi:predicted dehydrogenase
MINVGIVGLGQSGWHLHATSLDTFADYRVAAVCDLSRGLRKRATETFGCRAYANADELFADAGVELVVLATPNSLHAAQTIAALEAGKNVVVEKPMAATLSEAEGMVAAAQRTGRLLTVFHNRRWDPDFQMLKALARRGVLGDLLTVDSRIYMAEELFGLWGTYGTDEFRPNWRLEAAYAGGYLADWAPHMVDQCVDLVGEWPTSVTANLRSDMWTDEVDDYFFMRLQFPSGPVATLEASNNSRIAPARWFVVGRKGALIAPGGFSSWSDMRVRAEIDGVVADYSPKDLGAVLGPRRYGSGEELSDYFYADLADALRCGCAPTFTAEYGRDIMVVLDAAQRSDATGETILLDR